MKNKFNYLFFIILFFSQIVQAQENSIIYYRAAEEYLRKGSLNKALIELDKVIKISPKFAEVYFIKGEIFEVKEEKEEAITQYSLAIFYNPNFFNAYTKRAEVYFELSYHKKYFINDINKAISLRPKNDELYKTKAYYYANSLDMKTLTPEFDSAIVAISKAISLAPRKLDYLKIRSDYRFKNKQHLLAISDISEAISKEPTHGNYFYLRSIMYFTTGNLNASLNDINSAIKLEPTNYLYFQIKGNIWYNLQKYNRAYTEYTTAINLLFKEISLTKTTLTFRDPLNIKLRKTLMLRGMSLVQEGKPFGGCDDFTRAQKMGEVKAKNYIVKFCN